MNKKKVVVYKQLAPELLAELEQRFAVTTFDGVNDGNRDAFFAALADADGMIGASVKFDAATLARAERLEIAATISVGFDTFDTGYLKERGIARVVVVGLATDFCVNWTAQDAVHHGFETVVIEEACRAIDLDGSLDRAWAEMTALGVRRAALADLAG